MKSIIINHETAGLPPGTPVYVGDRPAAGTEISIIIYDNHNSEQKNNVTMDELKELISKAQNKKTFYWININGLGDIEKIKDIAFHYKIHSLTIEDILNTEQQPKVEAFENYRYISLKSIQREKRFLHYAPKQKKKLWRKTEKLLDAKAEEFIIDQISMIIIENSVITIQEIAGDSFGGIRKRILENTGGFYKLGLDYLAYSILDAVVDEYYLSLDHIEDDLENLEERAAKTSDETFIEEIQDTKKYLSYIKRAMLPLRENLVMISRRDTPLLDEKLRPFIQDLRENLNNALAAVEAYRERLSNIMDVNLSVLSHQTNKVMKILAIISTIFIPLTFIAGIYGMNFEYMPELKEPFAYPLVLSGMGLLALIMVIAFKTRKWF